MEAEISSQQKKAANEDDQPLSLISESLSESTDQTDKKESSCHSVAERTGENRDAIMAAVRPNFKPPTRAKAPLFSLPVSSSGNEKPAWMSKLQSRGNSKSLAAAEESGNDNVPEWKKKFHQMKSLQIEKGITIMDLECSFRKIAQDDEDDESIHLIEDNVDSTDEQLPEWKKKLEKMKSAQEEKGVTIMDLESSFRKSPGKSSVASFNGGSSEAPTSPWKSPIKKSEEVPEWKRKLVKVQQVHKYRESQALPAWKQKLLKQKEEEVKKYQSPRVEELPQWKQKLIAKKNSTRPDDEDSDHNAVAFQESIGLMSVPFRDDNQSGENELGSPSPLLTSNRKEEAAQEKKEIRRIEDSSDDDSASSDSSDSISISPRKVLALKDEKLMAENRSIRSDAKGNDGKSASYRERIGVITPASRAGNQNAENDTYSAPTSITNGNDHGPHEKKQIRVKENLSDGSVSTDSNASVSMSPAKAIVSNDDVPARNQPLLASSRSDEKGNDGKEISSLERIKSISHAGKHIAEKNTSCSSSPKTTRSEPPLQAKEVATSFTDSSDDDVVSSDSSASAIVSLSKPLVPKDCSTRKFSYSSDDSDSTRSDQGPVSENRSRTSTMGLRGELKSSTSDDSSVGNSELKYPVRVSNEYSCIKRPANASDSTNDYSDGGNGWSTPTRRTPTSFDQIDSDRVAPTDLDEFTIDDFSVSTNDNSPIVAKSVKTIVFPSSNSPKPPKRIKSLKIKSPTKSPKKSPRKTKASNEMEIDQKEKKTSPDKKDRDKEKKHVKKEKKKDEDKPKKDAKEKKKKKEEKSKVDDKERKHNKDKEKEKHKKHRDV